MEWFDHSPDEIESREELAWNLGRNRVAGLVVQGLDLRTDPPDWGRYDVAETLFVGCRFDSPDTPADLVRRGAYVVPAFTDLPFSTQPHRLYTAADLAAGFAEHGFKGMYDTIVYEHFLARGGALPHIRDALAQRLHDHGMDDGLTDTIDEWTSHSGGPVVGIMGGHAEPRGSAGYRAAAAIGHGLARGGCLVVTGGGPGVMEAANLGAFLSTADPSTLAAAIDALSVTPDFHHHDPFTESALAVRERFTRTPGSERQNHGSAGAEVLAWARHGGLSVPTWLYGHEPANLFAARIAKYFSNAIREDTILRLARGGIVFASGRAGTVQEIFQAATKTFYATDGSSGPFVFLGARFWTAELPVATLLRPLFAASPHGDLTHLIRITDDPAEAIATIMEYAPPAEAKEAQRTTP